MTVANLTKDPIAKKPGQDDNPLGLKGVDHIEFLVDNADEWSTYHESKLGMYRRAYGDPSTGLKGRKAFVVGQGRVNFLFAEPAGSGPEADAIRAHIAKHGNGVKDVAFRVKDVAASLAAASKAGAKVVRQLDTNDGFTGGSIAAYGDTIHTFISRTNHAQFAPGYVNMPGGVEEGEIQFMMIDHIVANVENMNEWVEYYHRVFGFDETRHFDINTGKSALMSKVVGPTEGYVKLPINEPSSENSQIQEFLNEYKGPGVQHIALLTNDIIQTVGEMRNRGMNFLDVPDTYYELMPSRVGEIKESIEPLKKLRILVDRDRADGYLLQLFSQPIFDRPTLFYEVIQRRGNSDGFGEGNFTALFEAIEREQMKRGTLEEHAMRLATVYDKLSNEPRPVFELPGGQRVELRELFRVEPTTSSVPDAAGADAADQELADIPLYFTDLAKTVEFLDDVIDAVRQWSRQQSDRADAKSEPRSATRVDQMPFLPPVPVVRNFREFDAFEQHAKTWRTRHDLKLSPAWYDAPSFVFANAASLIGHENPVHAPTDCDELDYGLQIGAIIGRGGRDIRSTDAWKHIAGFTIVNSFAARDIERREIAVGVGRAKSRDFATAVGPYLASLNSLRDRIDADDRLHLAMCALVNGNELSRADASSMFFTWPQLIEHASRNAELYPGDLISSGTVGTGSVLDLGGSNAAPWLRAGDVVELEVERLGILRTPIVNRPSHGTTGVAQAGAVITRTALSI